jgi:polar amino acid transport system substrate-binding protein
MVNSYSRTRRHVYWLVTAIWMFFYCAFVTAQDKYIIAVNEAYSFDSGASNVRTLFTKIYAPLGIKPVVEFYPSLRGLKLVNEGKIDAEAGRTAEIGKQYSNLIKVSYPIMQHQNGYFCVSAKACEISNTTRFAVVSGFETGKNYCKENRLNCLTDQSHGVIARALVSGAIDVLMASLNTATKALCTLKNKPVFYKKSKVLDITSYHFIHKKHSLLEPALAASIQNLAKRGEISRLLENATVVNTNCPVVLIELL